MCVWIRSCGNSSQEITAIPLRIRGLESGGEVGLWAKWGSFFLPQLLLTHWCYFLPQVPPGIGWVPGTAGPIFPVPVHVAMVRGTFGYHHIQYSILAAAQVGLRQCLGTWAWLALLYVARLCIHFCFWAAACFWLRKNKLLMFLFTQNYMMNGKVLIASIIFYSLGIPFF